ncbi:MAG: glutamyl-tRNA reductase [Gammaproteobacteria bacterium]|nr:glutamyl-tRNA reductase [Gammaproteobacteria bacterium]
MSLAVIGVNYRTAPVAVRERLAFVDADLPRAVAEIRSLPGVNEAALLSTCNRTEIYCDLESADNSEPVRWLTDYHGLCDRDVAPYLFRHTEPEAVRHLLRVAAGLDSMVLGEPQILGQIKAAYRAAVAAGGAGKTLNRLFQHSFAVAKRIRTDTAIGSSPVSVAFAAVRLAQQIHGELRDCTALVIGAGDTIELVTVHLHQNGLGRLIVANRSIERAQQLAGRFAGYAITLADLHLHLAEADVVISATASRLPILGKGAIETALRQRRHRPMFLVDIAVPRDMEPEIGELDDVYLYTVDDLDSIIDENVRSRQVAALQADEIVATQTHHFLEWLRANDAVETVTRMRRRTESVRDAILASARRQLGNGADPDEVLTMATNKLVNKLLHEPTVRLREAGAEGRTEIIDAAIELFGIDRER